MRRDVMKIFVVLGLLLLAACGGAETDQPILEDSKKSAEQLYNEALDASQDGQYKTAVRLFEEVERLYPFSPWAVRSQLLYGFTLYEDRKYEQAIAALERFLQLNPGHEDIDYANYLIALCYYDRIKDVGRDQSATLRALDALRAVVRRFPTSDYAKDARLKIDLTLDQLAGKEMTVGRFYLNRDEYLAAIKRFRIVVDKYDTTRHVAESLHRLTEAYLALGLADEAKKNAAVLGYNYPGSRWYEASYELMEEHGLIDESTIEPKDS